LAIAETQRFKDMVIAEKYQTLEYQQVERNDFILSCLDTAFRDIMQERQYCDPDMCIKKYTMLLGLGNTYSKLLHDLDRLSNAFDQERVYNIIASDVVQEFNRTGLTQNCMFVNHNDLLSHFN